MSTRGDFLRLARQRRGLTQIQAAPLLGLQQTVLSRMENDLIEVTDEMLNTAASAYRFPFGFFVQNETVLGPPVSVHPMLRGHSNVTAKDIDMLTAELNIRFFNMRRFLTNVDLSNSLNVPELDIEMEESPRAVARKVRLHWQLTHGPIKNLTRLLERAGVIVGTSEFGGAQISGVMFRPPSSPPIILFNPKHPADRVRFTLAHELGHLVMHRFPTSTMESEANEFASEFMMPSLEMKQAFRGRKVTIQYLAALKREWRMSMQSLLMAAKNVNAIDDNQYRYIFTQFSKKGWRTKEPAELDFPHDYPVVLQDIIKVHRSDLGYSEAEIYELTRLHKEEFEMLYGPQDDNATPNRPRLRIVT